MIKCFTRANEVKVRGHMEKTYIINAKRTAIGKFLGSLYEADPTEVCTQLIQKGFQEINSKGKSILCDVESVIVGNVISAGMGQGIARKIALSAGVPQTTPAYSLNMVCGSGMQAIRSAMNEIQSGMDLVLCGGLEFMSNIPYATNSYIRLGKKFGDFNMVDLMTHDGLLDSFSGVHMGITAENIAKAYGITRQEQDEYSDLTRKRAISAIDSGKFKQEIVKIILRDYKGNEYSFDLDEFPNRGSNLEKLQTLKPTFLKNGNGTVTAGNTSGINDGAAFLLVASEKYCKENGIVPIAELCEGVSVGCDPQLMGLGAFYAIQKLLRKTEKKLSDIDYFEINEAFAAQVLGCYRLLADEYGCSVNEIIRRSNIYGSGIGLGHPLGATGARIVVTLAHILEHGKGEYGIASLCIGGGMGTAVLLRKVDENEFIKG